MKKAVFILLAALMLFPFDPALAQKARSIASQEDSAFHAGHLRMHLSSSDCHATGNYIKAYAKAGTSGRLAGHLEQADTFLLLDVQNGLAHIQVTSAASSSPDSYDGMCGWVNADYIDCPCSAGAYLTRLPSSPGVLDAVKAGWYGYESVLEFFYNAIAEEWDTEKIISDSGFVEPYYFPASRESDGFIFKDLNADGINELILLNRDYLNPDVFFSFLTAVYTLSNGAPVKALESWTRSRNYLCADGSIYNEGSNGAAYSVYYIYDLKGAEFRVREGVLSGDYLSGGETEYGWFFVTDRADSTYTDGDLLSEDEADAKVKNYQASVLRCLDGFISFGEYEKYR